jgi:hypothetical protein
MPIYEGTPAGDVRRGIASGTFVLKGDARKSVDAMIAAIDAERPHLRLTLGSTAYGSISTALAHRLSALEAQKEVALAADVDD